jgi:hypothetical protein
MLRATSRLWSLFREPPPRIWHPGPQGIIEVTKSSFKSHGGHSDDSDVNSLVEKVTTRFPRTDIKRPASPREPKAPRGGVRRELDG